MQQYQWRWQHRPGGGPEHDECASGDEGRRYGRQMEVVGHGVCLTFVLGGNLGGNLGQNRQPPGWKSSG